MKKVIGLCSCILLCSVVTTSFAQELKQSVISSAGGTSTGDKISLEWTLGEPVVEVSTSSSYTQGFHQPIIVERKPWHSLPSIYYVSVAPNPVISQLNVRARAATKAVQIRLVDMKGTTVYLGQPTNQVSTVINMSSFKSGTYLLSIIDASGNQLESFKVIKL